MSDEIAVTIKVGEWATTKSIDTIAFYDQYRYRSMNIALYPPLTVLCMADNCIPGKDGSLTITVYYQEDSEGRFWFEYKG